MMCFHVLLLVCKSHSGPLRSFILWEKCKLWEDFYSAVEFCSLFWCASLKVPDLHHMHFSLLDLYLHLMLCSVENFLSFFLFLITVPANFSGLKHGFGIINFVRQMFILFYIKCIIFICLSCRTGEKYVFFCIINIFSYFVMPLIMDWSHQNRLWKESGMSL